MHIYIYHKRRGPTCRLTSCASHGFTQRECHALMLVFKGGRQGNFEDSTQDSNYFRNAARVRKSSGRLRWQHVLQHCNTCCNTATRVATHCTTHYNTQYYTTHPATGL